VILNPDLIRTSSRRAASTRNTPTIWVFEGCHSFCLASFVFWRPFLESMGYRAPFSRRMPSFREAPFLAVFGEKVPVPGA